MPATEYGLTTPNALVLQLEEQKRREREHYAQVAGVAPGDVHSGNVILNNIGKPQAPNIDLVSRGAEQPISPGPAAQPQPNFFKKYSALGAMLLGLGTGPGSIF